MIALIDANSFYCSCEQLFNPALWGKEMVISTGGSSGCVVSATKKAKHLGIGIGDPYFKIKETCKLNDIKISNVSFQRCSDMSSRLMCFLDSLGFEVERYSVDEAFIHLPDTIDRDWEEWFKKVTGQCFRLIGIPISVGIAKTKTLAKIASLQAKKKSSQSGGVFLINKLNKKEILLETPVHKIWMLGKASAEVLKSFGIRNGYAFMTYKYPERLYKKGRRFIQIREELEGVHHYQAQVEAGKSVVCSRTFDKAMLEMSELKQVWSLFLHQSCSRIRKRNQKVKKINLFARTSFFKPLSRQFEITFTLEQASHDSREIISKAFEALDQSDFEVADYRKVGISFLDIGPAGQEQLSLFQEKKNDQKQSEKLLDAIDSIQHRFGGLSIRSASIEKQNKKKGKRLGIEDLPVAV